MSTTTESPRGAASFAPGVLAVVAIVVGLFVPFVGLPLAMVAVVAIAVANIRSRRLLRVTVGLVVASIVINLALVMVALPAARELVEAL